VSDRVNLVLKLPFLLAKYANAPVANIAQIFVKVG
jgi:hypothetical protein